MTEQVIFSVVYPVVGSRELDPTIQVFQSLTDAEELEGNNLLASYIRELGLMQNWRAFPMKASQNIGEGTVAYGWGELTENHMQQVGGSWGVNGFSRNGSSDYGYVSDFLGSETLTIFYRGVKVSNTVADSYIVGQYDYGSSSRSVALCQTGTISSDPISLFRSSNGSFLSGGENYGGSTAGLGVDACYVAQWVDGGGRYLWTDNNPESLTLNAGAAQTSRYNSNANISVGCALNSGSPASFSQQTDIFIGFMIGNLTNAEREKITDLINAL